MVVALGATEQHPADGQRVLARPLPHGRPPHHLQRLLSSSSVAGHTHASPLALGIVQPRLQARLAPPFLLGLRPPRLPSGSAAPEAWATWPPGAAGRRAVPAAPPLLPDNPRQVCPRRTAAQVPSPTTRAPLYPVGSASSSRTNSPVPYRPPCEMGFAQLLRGRRSQHRYRKKRQGPPPLLATGHLHQKRHAKPTDALALQRVVGARAHGVAEEEALVGDLGPAARRSRASSAANTSGAPVGSTVRTSGPSRRRLTTSGEQRARLSSR